MESFTGTSDWQQMQEGNREAFDKIYYRHVQHLFNYGLRFRGGFSAVEDVVQELFCELWQNRTTVAEPRSERFYLLGILRNKLIRQYRREQPFAPGINENVERSFGTEPSSEQRWIELEITAEQRDRIQAAMQTLTSRQREVLYLRYFNDLTYEEISSLTGLTYQSARSQVYHALKIMRTLLDQRSIIAFLATVGAL